MCPVVSYARSEAIPQEAPHEIEEKKPEPSWPQHGSIKFDKITMSYRPGLPNVLKGISLDIKGGEKIGVVGRCVNVTSSFTTFVDSEYLGLVPGKAL